MKGSLSFGDAQDRWSRHVEKGDFRDCRKLRSGGRVFKFVMVVRVVGTVCRNEATRR